MACKSYNCLVDWDDLNYYEDFEDPWGRNC